VARHRGPAVDRLRRGGDAGGAVHAGRDRGGGTPDGRRLARPPARRAGRSRPLSAGAPAGDPSAPSPGAAPLFRGEGLCKRFGGVQAVRDVSLAVAAGTTFAIIGPNGAGKSTLLNLMSGIY